MTKKVLQWRLESLEFVMRELMMEPRCKTAMDILARKREALLVKLKTRNKQP